MAGAEESNVKRREHEPITLVCFVVLMLASVLVIGAWASDQISGAGSETVQYGDSVTVEYTGSLYGYYDQGTADVIPVIFDTNVKSIGTDSSYQFLSTFNGTYSKTTLTLGAGKFLAGFEDGLMGKKVGDTVRITIPEGEGYPVVMDNVAKSSFTLNNNFVNVSKSELSDYFEDVSDFEGMRTLTSKLCDNLTANVTKTSGGYTYSYNFDTTEEYIVHESDLGKVTLKATTTGAVVNYTLTIAGTKPVKDADNNTVQIMGHDAIEMLSLKLFKGTTYNIVAGSETDLVVNSITDGKAIIGGYELYFVVKIVSKN